MMKILLISMMAIWLLNGCNRKGGSDISDQKEDTVTLNTQMGKTSYAIGYNTGKNIKGFNEKIDKEIVMKGFKDGLNGKDPMIKIDEIMKLIGEFQQQLQQQRGEDMQKLAEKNKTEGEAFLVENKNKPGVVATPSGLQYQVIKEGKGAKPKPEDQIRVHYKGYLLNGTEFDSSYKRNEPIVFVLNKLIPGWVEGIQLMNVGSVYKFFIPSHLAYGPRGAGADIGPNATLIFEVELLAIEGQPVKKVQQ